MQITFNIPTEHIARVVTAINAVYPQKGDAFTPAQWAKEVIRRRIIRIVLIHERNLAQQAVDVPDDIVT